jgi:hypothetical protein
MGIIDDGEVLPVSEETAQALQAGPALDGISLRRIHLLPAFAEADADRQRHPGGAAQVRQAVLEAARAAALPRREQSLGPPRPVEIVEALDRSRYLLLVASPEAVESKWVKRETEHWLERGGERSLIILLTDGEIAWDDATQRFNADRTSAIPSPLLAHLKTEPLYVAASPTPSLK